MESVESRAKEALEAYLKCKEKANTVYEEKRCNYDCDNCDLNYAQGTYGDHIEAVKTAIQALEKQISEKPHEVFENFSGVWCKCGKYFGKGYFIGKPNYCPDCGQRLDWSSEKNEQREL